MFIELSCKNLDFAIKQYKNLKDFIQKAIYLNLINENTYLMKIYKNHFQNLAIAYNIQAYIPKMTYVEVPFYEGFNQFAAWPAENKVNN